MRNHTLLFTPYGDKFVLRNQQDAGSYFGVERDRALTLGCIHMTNSNHNEYMQVAHGFNEELTIILNGATLAARLLGPEHPANDAILELKRSANRCAELTRKLSRAC